VNSARIVVAEDDPTVLRGLVDRLTSEGFDVRTVETPTSLGEHAEDLDADLVVSAVSERGPRVQLLRQQSDVLFVALLPRNTPVMDALEVMDGRRRLRARIEKEPANPRWIQTVWSVGYRFTP
jgi:DNA-binding response OmpR family regulator